MAVPIQTVSGVFPVSPETRLPPVASASTALGRAQGAICFLHPAYNEATNVLFRMPKVDRVPSSTSARFGVHHRTALAACQIVANNAFDGFLAFDAAGAQRVDASVPLDGILMADEYYFIVPNSCPPRYPIVPSFRDWQFPHGRIPDFWPQPEGTLPVPPPSPLLCAVTGYSWAVQRAHLVPSNERAWFERNGMNRYGVGTVVDIDDPANCIPLKSDVHQCLDTWAFVLAPKLPAALSTTGSEGATANTAPNPIQPPTDGSQQAEYAVHILAGADPMFSRLHHDIRVPPWRLASCSREFLYARFALAILMGVKTFVTFGQRRRVARFMVVDEERGPELVEEDLDGPALFALYGAGKSRSASPPKRRRVEETGLSGDQQGAEQESDGSSDEEEVNGGIWERYVRDIEEQQRGRPRKRARRSSGPLEDGIHAAPMGPGKGKPHNGGGDELVEVWAES